MRKEIVFDLETKNPPQGWGVREELRSLGVSVAGVWSSWDDRCHIFREEEIPKLASMLKEADRLIGFAINKFDIPVLQPYLDFDLSEIPAIDIFEDVQAKLGHRVSLASLAKATLGSEKLGKGLDAIAWYKQGDWAKLEAYCIQDVVLTRDLYHFGRQHGHLLFESFVERRVVSVPVKWDALGEETVRAVIDEARGRQRVLEISYVSRENNGGGFLKARKIEVRAVRGEDIEAYDHLRGDIRVFRIGRILSCRILEEEITPRLVPQSLFS